MNRFLFSVPSFVMIVRSFLCVSLIVLTRSSVKGQESVGVRVRMTDAGLNYSDKVGMALFNDLISTLKIDQFQFDLKGSIGYGQATARNMRIIEFRQFTRAYSLQPPNTVSIRTGGGRLSIRGDWVAWYTILFKIWFKGYFTVSVSDINLSLSSKATADAAGKPHVDMVSCKAKIGSVSVTIGGDFIATLIGLFSGYIGSAIRSQLESHLCAEGRTVFVNYLNQMLDLPTESMIDQNLLFHYRLEGDPVIASNYVQGLFNGSVTWKGVLSTPIVCQPLPDVRISNERMIYIWLNEYVFNTFFYSVHTYNLSVEDVDRHMDPELASFLRTTCPDEFCIGTLSEVIRDRFPNQYAMFELRTLTVPTATIATEGIEISGNARMELYVEPKRPSNFLLAIDLQVSGRIEVDLINNQRLVGNLSIEVFHTKVNRSAIGDISIELLLAEPILREVVQTRVNQYLIDGILLPVVPGVRLRNAKLATVQRAIQIESDVVYKNYTFARRH